MSILKIDRKYRFISQFDLSTGRYVRSGILDDDGNDTDIDPFMTNFPELLDIGIMGHCDNVGRCPIQCYQGAATRSQPHMALDDFKSIIDQCKGLTFQVALGGRGDPDAHPQFEQMVSYCKANKIVPNFTTSGINLTSEAISAAKENCGAVAVSYHGMQHTYDALRALMAAGITTNIHFVLGNSSIDKATALLGPDSIASQLPVNAVIFLLHKPVGQGSDENVLAFDDPRLAAFFIAIDKGPRKFKIGFDSCTVPAIVNFSKVIDPCTVEPCDAGRFSAYIGPDLIATPCSLDQDAVWGVDLHTNSIQQAWDSTTFSNFRQQAAVACPGCSKRSLCLGGCQIIPSITLCGHHEI